MRYMMIVRGDENFAASGPPPMELMEAIGKLGEEAAKAGKMVTMGGLRHSSEGARVRLNGGKIVTTDGPFTEAKEVLGGFTIMNLASKQEAIEEAVKFMELHRKYWPAWSGETEIRLMYEDNEHP
ncbi:MAG: YciI family protein [Gemmatimonas sp.]